MESLLADIRRCTVCEASLPHGCRPVVSASPASRIAIIGQAPGRIVHASGIPWDDQSGKNLRNWLGVDKATFYDPSLFAIIPMGFCYPGTGKSGDLPPRPECAPLWHAALYELMPHLELSLLIGQYAQKYYMGKKRQKNLTTTVQHYRDYLPDCLPLPHPSPRNNIWQRKNPWFAEKVLPILRSRISEFL